MEKIVITTGNVLRVDLPKNTRLVIYRYDAARDRMVDTDPFGKPCAAQIWEWRDKILHRANVYVRKGKFFAESTSGVEVVIREE